MTSIWVARHNGISYHCADRAHAEALASELRDMGVDAVVVLMIREAT